MINIGDRVIFDSSVFPEDAYLNGSVVNVLKIEIMDEDTFALIEFGNGDTMDVEMHELKEIKGE